MYSYRYTYCRWYRLKQLENITFSSLGSGIPDGALKRYIYPTLVVRASIHIL